MKTLEQKIKELSPARRKKIKQRAAQLIAEEMSVSYTHLTLPTICSV